MNVLSKMLPGPGRKWNWIALAKRLRNRLANCWPFNVKGKALSNLWKMTRWMRPALIVPVLLILVGCAGSNSVGVSPNHLPPSVAEPCPHPLDVIRSVRGSSVGSDEVRMGRLGDALIECGAEKKVAVDAYDGLRTAVIGEKGPV
jgi:hypothetical protein